jgi:hypothetical protein
MRPAPSGRVVAWITARPVRQMYTSAVTVAEVLYGIERLPAGRRQEQLRSLATEVFGTFAEQAVAFDSGCGRAVSAGGQSPRAAGPADRGVRRPDRCDLPDPRGGAGHAERLRLSGDGDRRDQPVGRRKLKRRRVTVRGCWLGDVCKRHAATSSYGRQLFGQLKPSGVECITAGQRRAMNPCGQRSSPSGNALRSLSRQPLRPSSGTAGRVARVMSCGAEGI